MTASAFSFTIIADGTYAFPKLCPGKQYVLELVGTFGDGTATLGYDGGGDTFLASASQLTATGLAVIRANRTGIFAVKLENATAPALNFYATECV